MKEFLAFLTECQTAYNACQPCNGNCPNNLYCTAHECQMSFCSQCMRHIQWDNPPSFTYNCQKITYHYVLRFLNRFASEIAYAMYGFKFNPVKKCNVVSLGCGPGSEVYGIIQVLISRKLPITLDYQGYDLNESWKDVQEVTKRQLAQSGYKIQFYRQDMFNSFAGFDGEGIDLLVLNYLLSDVEKFSNNKAQKEAFIRNLAWFVIMNGVNNILFNDNNYYGHNGSLDSGVQLMLRLIGELREWQVNVKDRYRCFPSDPFRGNQQWKFYTSSKLLFPLQDGNDLDKNVRFCNSKQILIHID